MFRVEKWEKMDTMGANVLKQALPFVSKEETRYVLMNVHVRGIWIEATDGHRAVRFLKSRLAVKENIPDGLYTVAKEGQDFLLVPSRCEGQFPNLNVIIPKKWRREFRAFPVKKDGAGMASLAFRLARAGVMIDPRLLRELPSDHYTVGVSKPLSPVMFRGEVFEVVLMPMRGDKGAAFAFGTFERERYEEEAEEDARQTALAEAEAAASVATDCATLTPEEVKADVDKLNAILAGPVIPGTKEIAPACPGWVAAMRAAGVKP